MMSNEKESEEKILHHFYHQHPLSLNEVRIVSKCYGCRRYIFPKETAYTCRKKCWYPILHEECAEMPREITLSMHSQHTLIQKMVSYITTCLICKENIDFIGYHCTSSDPCGFQVHVGCALNIQVRKDCIDHPSHPHQLTLLQRPGQSCSFRCDACGTTYKGESYICIDCQYWIHKNCAAMPPTLDLDHHHHHHHQLSLVYHVPLEYIKLNLKCNLCSKDLLPRYWVYHCETCRYVVHTKCAADHISNLMRDSNLDDEDEDVVIFPTYNSIEEVIGTFVTQVQGREMAHPNETIAGEKYMFPNHHHHQLRLLSSLLHDEEEKKDEDDEDDDEFLYRDKSELVCDGCMAPIIFQQKSNTLSSSSSSYSWDKYLSCDECNYILHWACSQLPPLLLSHPIHARLGHTLVLEPTPKLKFTYCYICKVETSGLVYRCKDTSDNSYCGFQADARCMYLPHTIRHQAHPHPHHHLRLLNSLATDNRSFSGLPCRACGGDSYANECYKCHACDFMLHVSCSLFPAQVSNRTWDKKHPLLLRLDAAPSRTEFYCDICENKMNPKKRCMYHCGECDVSVHPDCLQTATGRYRNIKTGHPYLVAGVHDHPLAFGLLTTKLRCDVCGNRRIYGSPGFQCGSDNCDFFMCLDPCGKDRKDAFQAVVS